MATNKTAPTDASVDGYLTARANAQQRADSEALIALMRRITGAPPTMWGPSIVGFGAYRYRYESGRTGEAPLAAFAIRGRDMVVYLHCEGERQQALLAAVGRHRMSVSCLYFKRLADLDVAVLEALIVGSIDAVREREGRRPADTPEAGRPAS